MLAVLGRVFVGQYVIAGIVISLAAPPPRSCSSGGSPRSSSGTTPQAARRSLLAIFPLSFFLQAVYSESLFLVLAIATFYFARKERWALAAAALALVVSHATDRGRALDRVRSSSRGARRCDAGRSSGSSRHRSRSLTFPILLKWQTGDALAFIHAEKYWHRSFSALGPLGGIIDGAKAAAHGLHAVIATSTPPDWTYPANLNLKETAAVNVESFAWLVLFLALTVVVWRVLGAAYGAYAAVSLAIPLAEPWNVFPLFSLPRFGLVIFPFFMVLGLLARTRVRLTALDRVLDAAARLRGRALGALVLGRVRT